MSDTDKNSEQKEPRQAAFELLDSAKSLEDLQDAGLRIRGLGLSEQSLADLRMEFKAARIALRTTGRNHPFVRAAIKMFLLNNE